MSRFAVLPEFALGQVFLRFWARVLSIVGSAGESLLKNVPQCARPNVCAPDNATTSVTSKFWAAKTLSVTLVVLKGCGRLLVSLMLKVLPSFLPSGTGKLGPPDCRMKNQG